MSLEKAPLHLQKSFAQIYAIFPGILAFLALALVSVVIYGVVAYLASQRIAEIGIRMALGAARINVIMVVIVDGLRPVLAGIVLGLIGAAAVSAALHATLIFPGSADVLYGVPFYDPPTFIGLTCFFVFIAAIASLVPTWRAVRLDPMLALRYE